MRKNVEAGRVHGNPIIIKRDIYTLSVDEFLALTGIKLGDVDVLIGGPPCQSFSTAGKRQSTQDPRGTLLWDFLRFVDGLRPKFFLMENVRSEEHTSELQSLMRISYAVFCLKKKKTNQHTINSIILPTYITN